MFILWVAYQMDVALVPWHDPNVIKTEIMFFINQHKCLEWFPLISLYNMFRVIWAHYFVQ